jgi:hypothetical protein
MAKKAGKQKTTKKVTTTNQKEKAKSRLARARSRGAKDAQDRFSNMSGSDAFKRCAWSSRSCCVSSPSVAIWVAGRLDFASLAHRRRPRRAEACSRITPSTPPRWLPPRGSTQPRQSGRVAERRPAENVARTQNAGVPYASYTSPCSAIFSSS